MGRQDVRVVVGETGARRDGLLASLLEVEGFAVVGTATDAAELASALVTHRPDVVVLDDGIGVAAVGLVHEALPSAKVVLVWPGAVVPIGGDARVEPANVIAGLSAALDRVVGPRAIGDVSRRTEWIDRVRRDPSTLREMLSRPEGPPRHPAVTPLQRRGRPLRPAAGSASEEEREPAAVVMLTVAASAGSGPASAEPTEPAVMLPSAPRTPRDLGVSELNRKLGRIALGSAAVAGALILALSLGGPRLAVQVRSAPPIVDTSPQPTEPVDPGDPIVPSGGDDGSSPSEPRPDRDGGSTGTTGVDAGPDLGSTTDPSPEPKPDPEPDPGPDPDPDPDPDPGPDPDPDPGPDPTPDPDDDPTPRPRPDPEPDPAPEPDPKPDPGKGADDRGDDAGHDRGKGFGHDKGKGKGHGQGKGEGHDRDGGGGERQDPVPPRPDREGGEHRDRVPDRPDRPGNSGNSGKPDKH